MRISKKVISLLFVIILAVSVSAFATVAFAVEENANSSNNAIGNNGSNISNDYSQVAGSVSLSKSQITLGVNEKYILVANIKNTNKDNQPIIWNVTDNSIISVENGSVTANASGTAVVSAKLQNGSTANCTIKVLNAPTNISLNKTSITLGVGETFDLNSSLPAGCGAYSIVYSTNNSAVATVKALGGLVTAKSAGTAKITATTYNGKTVTCTVNVKKAPTSVALNKTSVTLGVGETFDLNSSLPAGCGAYSVKYSTNNSAVATVKTSGGLVTAKSTGTAKITATTYNGKTVTCTVNVKKAPTSVALNKTSVTLGIGEIFDLNSSLPTGCSAYSVKYSTNNSSIATVKTSGGLVTAKSTGTAKITATTYNGKTVSCTVTIKKAPTSVTLNKSVLSVQTGNTFDLNSKVSSGSASYSVKYTSSNPKVATVKSSGGIVTGTTEGTATITATTYNGKKATCKVTVGSYTEDDLFCLAAVIWQEAGSTYCSDTLQYYVGNVVLNRVDSPDFPNSIRNVITSRGQYGTMYWSGVSIPNAKDPITAGAIERCYDKAKKLLEGYRPLPKNVVYQAGFVQGSGVHSCVDGMYFCYR